MTNNYFYSVTAVLFHFPTGDMLEPILCVLIGDKKIRIVLFPYSDSYIRDLLKDGMARISLLTICLTYHLIPWHDQRES